MGAQLCLRLLERLVEEPRQPPQLQRTTLLVRFSVVGRAHEGVVVVRGPLAVHDVAEVPDVLQHQL